MSRHIFDTSDPVKKIGERALISRILSAYGDTCPPAPRGGGDDCAVFGRDTLFKHNYITVDSLVYGRHFDDSCTAAEAGAKLLKRNISDIASMGGVPQRAVIAAVIIPVTVMVVVPVIVVIPVDIAENGIGCGNAQAEA